MERILTAPAAIGGAADPYSGKSCAYYCCLLLEYLQFHGRWSDLCSKTLEIVNNNRYRVMLDHKIAWLNMALNCTNGRTVQELPQKANIVDQIQLRLKVLHLHKLAHDRLRDLLTIRNNDYTKVKRWAIRFRMWNFSSPSAPFFPSAAGIGPSHTFEDSNHRGIYDNHAGCLRDPDQQSQPCSSMLGFFDNGSSRFENGLLARYRDDICNGEVLYLDHAFFRKILSNSMFFDLEIMLLHTVLPIQNQREIHKCIEKIMVQSWFNDEQIDHPDRFHSFDVPDDVRSISWDDYCMRLDYDQKNVGTKDSDSLILKKGMLLRSDVQDAISSLRRLVHDFLDIAPKSQDTLRIMFPSEVLVTFACLNIGHSKLIETGQRPRILRHYVCAIADILLGYTTPLQDYYLYNMEDLDALQNAHVFISYNALNPEGYGSVARTRTRDRCLSLRNLWDAMPHIHRNLSDASILTVKLGLAARYLLPLESSCNYSVILPNRLACETAASVRFGISQDLPAVELAMQQYRVYHEL
jgi:hypothetical protein